MKPGNLVRFVDGPNRSYGTFDQPGLIISAYQRRISDGIIYYELKIMFPNLIFVHPHFPDTGLEVINEEG
jgi:hypothetical protein